MGGRLGKMKLVNERNMEICRPRQYLCRQARKNIEAQVIKILAFAEIRMVVLVAIVEELGRE